MNHRPETPPPSAGRTAEQQIDDALDLLRQVAPPSGLETRVRRRLAVSAPHRRVPFARPWSAMAAIAFAVVVLATFVVLKRPSAPGEHAAVQPAVHGPAASHQRRESGLEVASGTHPHASMPRPVRSSPASCAALRVARLTAAGEAPSPADSDRPAPPLPLSAEERLLLRIAYGDRPIQVAGNRRFMLPIRSDDDSPDFEKFFEPYTLPLTEGDPQ